MIYNICELKYAEVLLVLLHVHLCVFTTNVYSTMAIAILMC